MTTTERIEGLKAARRAELKAAEAEHLRQREAAARHAVELFERGVARALAEAGAKWLAEFRGDDSAARRSESLRLVIKDAVFMPPGHGNVRLTLAETSGGWVAVGVQSGGEWPTWAGVNRSGRQVAGDTLADALIAAEL